MRSPLKSTAVPFALRSQVAPQRCLLPSSFAKIVNDLKVTKFYGENFSIG